MSNFLSKSKNISNINKAVLEEKKILVMALNF